MVRLPWAFTRNTPVPGFATLELERELDDGTELDERIELELMIGTELELTTGTELEERTELELLVSGVLELERELLVNGADELGLLLELGARLDEVAQPVTPKGDGWLAQVVRDTQLLPFS